MATFVNEHFFLESEKGICDMEFFLNGDNQMVCQEANSPQGNFYFLLSREDWAELKTFIDTQFDKTNVG